MITPESREELPDVKWNCVSKNFAKKVENPPIAKLSVELAKHMHMKGRFLIRPFVAGHTDLRL